MSRRGDGNSLFIGRLSKSTRVRDLENIFEPYGRITRCEIKYGAEMAYGFIDFEDRRDAEDAIRFENGREICGSSVIVERVKGAPRRPVVSRGSYYDECYRCHRSGHFARDCPDDRYSGYRRSRGGRYRSPSPRRRRRSRSRSRGKRRRSRSRSGRRSPDRNSGRSRSRSRSQDRKRSRRSRSESRSKSKSVSRSRSKSPSPGPTYKSHSRSPSPEQAANGDTVQENSKSRSRSRSRSKSANSDD